MKYVLALMFGLLIWFTVEVDHYESKQKAACENKGGVLMSDRSSEYVCVKKEAIVK